MSDIVLDYLRRTLPADVAAVTESYIEWFEKGDYESLLRCPEAHSLFGHDDEEHIFEQSLKECSNWKKLMLRRLNNILAKDPKHEKQVSYFLIGYAALLSFIQSNVTGPPLRFAPHDVILPRYISQNREQYREIHDNLLTSLGVDGIAAYKLTRHLELLCLADAVATSPAITGNVDAARWIKVRTAFVHQRLLSEVSSTLQDSIYNDLDVLEEILTRSSTTNTLYIEFLLERSTIHLHHGLDKLARKDLDAASAERGFAFALTGLLGKRTKFQVKDISQLVVLAKSHADSLSKNEDAARPSADPGAKPTTLDLNDDTLLESISFSEPAQQSSSSVDFKDTASLPAALRELDPSNQPQLQPLDSVILLQLASSITNTSAQDGLTREETLPYATRVLEGGSSNWQVYTQALLVRSRIEGYRSRTVERGLLQLQAVVDQVIAETSSEPGSSPTTTTTTTTAATTFLPRATEAESAPVAERVRYVFQLASPTRWELEAELASRWVSLGGLRSALAIYERLEMWAEAALCWAGTDREDKARRLVRRQLFHASSGERAAAAPQSDAAAAGAGQDADADAEDNETWEGPARSPPPLDAPRLYCILGDIDRSAAMYETAWRVSGQRYARAQRSLGRLRFAEGDYVRAAAAYSLSLRANQLHGASWFALGCALLELAQFGRAAEAFSRCVQLDDSDAEAWSNLAAALLRTPPEELDARRVTVAAAPGLDDDDDEDGADSKASDGKAAITAEHAAADARARMRHDALSALKRAAALKRDSHRIWENVLVVAASTAPPEWGTVLAAQQRVLELRGATDGERAIDVDILERLVAHVIETSDKGKGPEYDASRPGLARMLVRFMDSVVVPQITGSARLWRLVSRLALWRAKPAAALEAEEKAWRAVTGQPGWETDSEKRWDEVVDATVWLCDAYESLGPRERTEGMGAGEEVVAKDWRFKARTAVRGIMGRGRDSWQGTNGWERLQQAVEGLRV